MSYMNLVHGLARLESFVAQWLEHRTGVRRVIGSIPSGTQIFSLSRASDLLITWFLMSIQFCYSLPGVAVGVQSSLKLPLNWLCQWYQEGKNAVLFGTKNDREKPHATVSVITLPPKIFVVRARKLRTGTCWTETQGTHQTQRDASRL